MRKAGLKMKGKAAISLELNSDCYQMLQLGSDWIWNNTVLSCFTPTSNDCGPPLTEEQAWNRESAALHPPLDVLIIETTSTMYDCR